MALKSMAMQFGTGTDIRGGDYTKAAVRAVERAIRQNAITLADAFGQEREAMQIKVSIGVAKPQEVDKAAVAAALPYGAVEVSVVEGGMDVPHEGHPGGIAMANAAVVVFLDLPDQAGESA